MQESLLSDAPPATGQRDLETELELLDQMLAAAEKAGKLANASLRKAHEGARTGNLRDLSKLLDGFRDSARALAQHATNSATSWTFQSDAYFARGTYLSEVSKRAEDAGLTNVREMDGQLFSYPVAVKLDARDLSVKLGKKNLRAMRPSYLAGLLKQARSAPARENLAPILHAMEKAYLQLSGGNVGLAVGLNDVYKTLTLLPGAARTYTPADFIMDVYRLDQAGPQMTKSGRRLDLPASTSTRGTRGTRFVTEAGDEKYYASIRFEAT